MKKLKNLLNIIIMSLAIFFAYQVFSYIKTCHKEKESIQIYKEIKTSSIPRPSKNNTYQSQIDFDKLKAINPEIFAWIRSDEGRIEYPLVRCGDNEKYLHTSADGQINPMGAVFMDFRNKSLDDDFILIYGHTTNNGTMFGSLNTFKENPKDTGFSFFTVTNEFKTKAVIAAIISGDTEIDPRIFDDFEKRKEFYDFLKDKAVYDISYELKNEDKLISLITCTYERENSRLLVLTVVENKNLKSIQ